MRQKAKIQNWRVVNLGAGWCLYGQVVEHPRQEQFFAERQYTSKLRSIDFEQRVAATENTDYILL